MIRGGRLVCLVAWRQKNTSEFKIISFALAFCIFSVTLVFNLVVSFNTLLSTDMSILLGAPLVLESPEPLPKVSLTWAKELGLKTANLIDFFSMIMAKDKMELVSLSSVRGDFPVRGKLLIRQEGGLIAQVGPPPLGEIWVEEGVLLKLGVKLYDKVRVGEKEFKITGVIEERPVALSDTSVLAPFAYVNEDDLQKMNVLRAGSRATYRLLLGGSVSEIEAFKNKAKNRLSEEIKWVTPESGRASLLKTVKTVNRYLSIILLIQAILAGMAIAMSAYHYMFRLQREVALWRCLGATYAQVLSSHTLAYLGLPFFVILVSVGLAYGVTNEIINYLKQWGSYPFSLTSQGALVGAGFGLILLLGFGLPPIMALRQVSPKTILQRAQETVKVDIKWYGFTFLTIAFLFSLGIQDDEFSLKFIIQLILLTSVCFGVIWVLWEALARLNKLFSGEWRLAISYLVRYRISSVFQCLVFSVIVTLLLLVYIFQTDFIKRWQDQLPVSTPNYFLINVQLDDINEIKDNLESAGVKNVEFFPIVRGRLTYINEKSVDAFYQKGEAEKGLYRPINLTWMKVLPRDNQIIEGLDWAKISSGDLFISVEKEFAKRQGVKLGDTFTFDVGGETIQAKIIQLREVEWESFKPNFFVIFPPGVLEKYPHSYISSFYLKKEEKKSLIDLVKKYSGVSIIDIDAILEKTRKITSKLVMFLTILFGLVGILGLLIMYASLLSTLKERMNESALLRILGANVRFIKKIFWIEFILLAGISGLLGSLMAMLLAQILAKQFFIMDIVMQLKWLLIGTLGSIVLIPIFGMIGTRAVFKSQPLRLFRELQ